MTIDGPERAIASPMITKMPVPMIAPMPSAVRASTPTARFRPCSPLVSRARDSVGLRADSPGRAVAAIVDLLLLTGRGVGLRTAGSRPRFNAEPPAARFRPHAPLHSKVVPEF